MPSAPLIAKQDEATWDEFELPARMLIEDGDFDGALGYVEAIASLFLPCDPRDAEAVDRHFDASHKDVLNGRGESAHLENAAASLALAALGLRRARTTEAATGVVAALDSLRITFLELFREREALRIQRSRATRDQKRAVRNDQLERDARQERDSGATLSEAADRLRRRTESTLGLSKRQIERIIKSVFAQS